MKPVSVFLLSLLLSSPISAAFAAGKEPIAFKGVKIGATIDEFQAAFPDWDCQGQSCTLRSRRCLEVGTIGGKRQYYVSDECVRRNSYGGVSPQSATATFVDSRLQHILLSINPTSYDQLVGSLTERYGKSSLSRLETIQNLAGATFMNKVSAWSAGGVWVFVSKYRSSIDEGYVTISADAYFKAEEKKRKQSIKEGARDL